MRTTNFISREYVNPIELDVLGKTYNTLEQGHKEAVKAASDLEVTLANLDLNEAESEWRQGKLAEIRQTVADNTIYGNSYSALDDVIAKAGNIASDQGMIGRLQAQKDFKAFKENLDKRTDLPQDYKDYFNEKNPYKYADKVDPKTGQIIGGTKWTPNTSPTAVIPLNELLNQGLRWAAKESGGGDRTQWIDTNGNVTSDPSKAYDGQVYNTTTNRWERLSKEKIMQGVKASIEATPGAKESLNQDYTIAMWKHDKNVVANNGKPIAGDVTDKNGVLLTPDQYLHKRIDPMVQAASYYNSTTSTNYGSGLASYKAGKKAEAIAAAQMAQANTMQMNQATMSGRNTPIEVPIDAASNYVAGKNIAANSMKNIYKSITGKGLYIPETGTIGNMEQLLDKYGIPASQRQQLRSLTKAYNESVKNLEFYTKDMNANDKREFEFAARMKSGGELKSSANGGSKYDDKIIKSINDIYGKASNLQISFDNDQIKSDFVNLLNGGMYNGYANLGLKEVNGKFILPKSSMYALPKIMDALEKAKANSNKGVFNTIGGFFNKRYSVDAIDENGKNPNRLDASFKPITSRVTLMQNLADSYKDATSIGNNISNKYKINPSTATLSSLNFDGNSFTDATLLDQYNKGIISKEQYDTQKKYYNESFDNILANTDFSQTDMYYMDEGGNTKKRVVNSADRFNYGAEILKAVNEKRVTVSPSVVPGVTDPLSGAPISGYNVTIAPSKDGKQPQRRFYIPGMVNETASQIMMQDPSVQSFNTISILGATKGVKLLTDNNTNPKLGNVSITGLGANQFIADFNGVRRPMGQEEAMQFNTAINNYNAVKNAFLSQDGTSANGQLNPAMRSTIANAAKTIGHVIGLDPNAVLERLVDDINK